MPRNIEQVVVLHIKDDGTFDVRVWGDERVCVFTIDENVPEDRLYEHLCREQKPAELVELIGDSPAGSIEDGRITPEMAQGMKAMLWRLQGNRLAATDKPQ